MTLVHKAYNVESTMQFIRRDSKVNRRYITPGVEVNTGKYEGKKVYVNDVRPIREQCKLDTVGFELLDHKTNVFIHLDTD